MSSGIRIDSGALLAAGKRCEGARDALKPLLPDFEQNAAPADGCFGLLERGGKELEESYREFHREGLGFIKDLVAKLGDTATGLRESAERQGGG
ncbi:hypothetical protein [Nonomuraea jabiensis]|uniref:hypothetical protein n=1 Tax=Nonomuraea jabiensis TaxID=882448 RepID=UPI0036BADBBF